MSEYTRERIVELAFNHRKALEAYGYSLLRDWPAAQDAFQETVLTVMQQWASYDPQYTVYTWARRIVYFKCLDQLKKRDRDVLTDDEELLSLVKQSVDTHLDLEAAERHERMQRALESCVKKLSRSSAQILTDYYWKNRTCEQIGEALGRSANAIRLALSRVRTSLKDCAGRLLAGGEVRG